MSRARCGRWLRACEAKGGEASGRRVGFSKETAKGSRGQIGRAVMRAVGGIGGGVVGVALVGDTPCAVCSLRCGGGCGHYLLTRPYGVGVAFVLRAWEANQPPAAFLRFRPCCSLYNVSGVPCSDLPPALPPLSRVFVPR